MSFWCGWALGFALGSCVTLAWAVIAISVNAYRKHKRDEASA